VTLQCVFAVKRGRVNNLTNKWVDISTVIAATAGLWALAFAWLTYWKAVVQKNQEDFLALTSIIAGLRVELELMKPWTGSGGKGYAKAMKPPDDWSQPGRLIWKFDIEAISSLTRSPYLYRLRSIIGPFARLNFSVSRLFQLYDEYRSFVNSDPGLALLHSGPLLPAQIAGGSPAYKIKVLDFNFQMHVNLIGGADSNDPVCLYRTYDGAVSALDTFTAGLSVERCPQWFWIGHFLALVCFCAGILLLARLVRP